MSRRMTWLVGVCLGTGLPLVTWHPASGGRSDARLAMSRPAAALTLSLSDGRLSVEASGVPWPQLLAELGRKTGIALRLAAPPEGQVTISLRDLPVERAFRRLFGPDAGLLYVYGADGHQGDAAILPSEVWVLGPGQRAADGATTSLSAADPSEDAAEADPVQPEVARVRAAVEEADEGAVPLLLGFLHDSLPAVRKEAVAVLAERRDDAPSVMDALIQTLVSDPDGDVRLAAADALGHVRSPLALEALRQALDDQQVVVQTSAAEAIALIGGDRAEAILREAMGRAGTVVAEAIAQVLQDAR